MPTLGAGGVDEMESLRAWGFLFASVLDSRESATGGLCNGLFFGGLPLGELLLLFVLELMVEFGVIESGAEAEVVDIDSGRAAVTC